MTAFVIRTGLQPPPTRRSSEAIGDELIRRWGIPAKKARFHREGSWYHPLQVFPAALCDPNGYVVFATEEEFRNCRELRITKDVNVRKGIAQIPGYIFVDPELRYEPK